MRPSSGPQLDSTWNGSGPEKPKLVYDPQQPIWSLLLWNETILPQTFKRGEIYVFTLIHTAMAVLKHMDLVDIWADSPINAIVAPVSLLAFFVVFYNSQVSRQATLAAQAQERVGWGGIGEGSNLRLGRRVDTGGEGGARFRRRRLGWAWYERGMGAGRALPPKAKLSEEKQDPPSVNKAVLPVLLLREERTFFPPFLCLP